MSLCGGVSAWQLTSFDALLATSGTDRFGTRTASLKKGMLQLPDLSVSFS